MHYYNRLPSIIYSKYYNRLVYDNSKPPFAFSHGRTALKYGLITLGLKQNDVVLIPEFICDVVVNPFIELGIQYNFYEVNDFLEPEWKNIKSKLTSNTKALMMVHYFGQPQDIGSFQKFCKENDLFLIEDNAHSHGASFNGKMLGTFGDIGFSSPRKNLPVLNGGYLYINNDYTFDPPNNSLQPVNIILKQLKSHARRIINLIPQLRKPASPPNYASQEVYREPILPNWGMGKFTHFYLQRIDYGEERKKRQRIYEIWQEWAVSKGLSPVFSNLHPEAMPLIFPAYSKSHEESKKWYEWGYNNRIDVHSWPTLPKEIVQKNGKAMRIWEKMVCFPIHSTMKPQKLYKKLKTISF